jgi:hypothetical protein
MDFACTAANCVPSQGFKANAILAADNYIYVTSAMGHGMQHCSIQSRNDWGLGSGRGKIVLEVFPNETFTETIHFESGKIEILRGKWFLIPG